MGDAQAFPLAGVAHLVRPTGNTARDLQELRQALASVEPRALFFHTLQVLLRDPAAEDLLPDDLSAWVNGVVQDRETAERLAFAVQDRCGSAAELRPALLQVLDGIPRRIRVARDAPEGGAFVFLAAESVPVPLDPPSTTPTELMSALVAADASVWFHHLIEQPWFADGECALSAWLRAVGDERLADVMETERRAGLPLEALRGRVLRAWRRRGLGARVAAATRVPETERRRAGSSAVVGLVRRMTRGGPAP